MAMHMAQELACEAAMRDTAAAQKEIDAASRVDLPDMPAKLSDGQLLAEAEKRKKQGNAHFANLWLEPAMQQYLSAIWLLKADRPPYPQELSGQQPPSDAKAVAILGGAPKALSAEAKADAKAARPESWLAAVGVAAASVVIGLVGGSLATLDAETLSWLLAYFVGAVALALVLGGAWWAWTWKPPPEAPVPPLAGEAAQALRISLHLNVALCALRREDWYVAREASRFVLRHQPSNAKALFRLAQAHEGEGELRAAVRSLTALLRLDGESGNREARALLAELKAREAKQKEMYRGVCDRSGFHAPVEPVVAGPTKPPKEDELTSRIRSLLEASPSSPPRARMGGWFCARKAGGSATPRVSLAWNQGSAPAPSHPRWRDAPRLFAPQHEAKEEEQKAAAEAAARVAAEASAEESEAAEVETPTRVVGGSDLKSAIDVATASAKLAAAKAEAENDVE